jgi:hypothetical protein
MHRLQEIIATEIEIEIKINRKNRNNKREQL